MRHTSALLQPAYKQNVLYMVVINIMFKYLVYTHYSIKCFSYSILCLEYYVIQECCM